MFKAEDVVSGIRKKLATIDNEIRAHRFLKGLEEKRVDLHALKAFPGHQYHIIGSDLQSVAMMIHRFSDPPVQSFFQQVLQGEFSAREGILVLARKMGMNEEELKGYPLMPEGFAYSTYMAWLSTYASAAEIVVGFLVNFAAWGHNCGRMGQLLNEHYGFSQDDTIFLDAFARMPSFEAVALGIIQGGLNGGVSPEHLHRAAYLFQGYERMFWDTMAGVTNL